MPNLRSMAGKIIIELEVEVLDFLHLLQKTYEQKYEFEMLKFFLKIWPALTPIIVYLFWIYVVDRIFLKLATKKNDIEGEKVVGEKSTTPKKLSPFSLENRCFVIVLYMSLILAILTLIVMAFSNK